MNWCRHTLHEESKAMPIHDWTKVRSGTFHYFHLLWLSTLSVRLNRGILPDGFFAMAEQVVGRPNADVVTLQTSPSAKPSFESGGVAVAHAKPKTTFVQSIEKERYARNWPSRKRS